MFSIFYIEIVSIYFDRIEQKKSQMWKESCWDYPRVFYFYYCCMESYTALAHSLFILYSSYSDIQYNISNLLMKWYLLC